MTADERIAHIVDSLGGHRVGSTWLCRCPAHHDHTPSLAVRERDGRLLVHCHAGCNQHEVIAALSTLELWPDQHDAAPRPRKLHAPKLFAAAPDPDRLARVADIIVECGPIEGTPADRYLKRRGIDARPLPDCIRWRPYAWRLGGALVALATADDGTVRAVQEVYVDDAGLKAGLTVAKRTHGPLAGAAVRLPGAPSLVLCEGVEDALTLSQATGRATWACLGVANIGRAPVPRGAELIIARDNDATSSPADLAIKRAEADLMARGCTVRVARPPARFKDWNDLHLGTRCNVIHLRRDDHAA
jgi:hypothetical protein